MIESSVGIAATVYAATLSTALAAFELYKWRQSQSQRQQDQCRVVLFVRTLALNASLGRATLDCRLVNRDTRVVHFDRLVIEAGHRKKGPLIFQRHWPPEIPAQLQPGETFHYNKTLDLGSQQLPEDSFLDVKLYHSLSAEPAHLEFDNSRF